MKVIVLWLKVNRSKKVINCFCLIILIKALLWDINLSREDEKMTGKKPNILVIFGDDIGISNLSCYSDGLMGYRTPNIDRIANEGIRFTDSYGVQSCTAGRASFITGQSPFRTGLTKVGMPGAKLGIKDEDSTIAELLKPLG